MNEYKSTYDLSVVVLCFKAEDYIHEFVKQIEDELAAEKIENYELILVANYSRDIQDSTPNIVKALAKHNHKIKVVSQEKRGKMGWDMRSGLKVGMGKFILVIDGDGQMPASDIPLVYNIIKNSEFDLVKTFRAKRFDGLYRTVLSKAYNALFKLLFQPNFPVIDVNSKPKIIRKSALDKMVLQSNDWFTDSEIMLQASLMNLKVCEVSSIFYRNKMRKSFISFATIIEFVINLMTYRFNLFGRRHAARIEKAS